MILLVAFSILTPAYAEGKEQRTELVIWNLPVKPAQSGPHAADIKRLDTFTAHHPEIKILMGGGPQLQRSGRGTREFLMAQAAGIAPDIVEMSDVDLQDFMSRGFLEPLDDFLEEKGLLEAVRRNPFARQYMRGGRVYALPERVRSQAFVLLYRKDYFRRAGLDPEEPPRTWKELLDYAEALTDTPAGYSGFVLPTIETKGGGVLEAGGFVELIMALNGVEVIRELPDGKWAAQFADNHRAIEAVEFIRELIRRPVIRDGRTYRGVSATSAGTSDDAIMFAQGGSAMIIQTMTTETFYSHLGRGVPSLDIGVALLPLGPGKGGYVPLTTRFSGINATSPTSERKRAAWTWIEFNRSREALESDARMLSDWGQAAVINPEDIRGNPDLSDFDREIPEQWAWVYHHQFDNAKPLPLCPEHRQLRLDYLARIVWELQKNPDIDAKALLREIEGKINKEVLGNARGDEANEGRNIALLVVGLVGLIFAGGMYSGIRGMARSFREDSGGSGPVGEAGYRRIYFMATLFLVPAVGSVLLWMYIPLIRGAMIAFQDYRIVGASTWVGLENFIDVLTDQLFWVSLLRTAQYAVISLSLGFVAPIILAFFLSEVPRGKVLFRVLYYLPAMTPAMVISFLWYWVYNPSSKGLLNTLVASLGSLFGLELGPYQYLDSESLAMISVIMPGIWAGLGSGSIIYLAALHGVPEEMYEAADLDGAGAWSKAWNISIPFIKPLILINFVGAVIATFYATQNIFVMTMGGPGNATYVTGLYIFFNSFVWLKFGKATAAAWILGSLLIGFMVYQLKILRVMRFQSSGRAVE